MNERAIGAERDAAMGAGQEKRPGREDRALKVLGEDACKGPPYVRRSTVLCKCEKLIL